MSKIAILHFSPLELYPPVQNLIRVLEQNNCTHQIYVFTTSGIYGELDSFSALALNIKIIRLGKSGQSTKTVQRIWTYFLFYFGSFLYLLWIAPIRILYYETISAFPAWLYHRFFKKVELLIHYHEYTTPAEYTGGMMLTRRFHQLEKGLYPFAKWVSHTNTFRMQLFENDILPVKIANPQIIPNYPPEAWYSRASADNALPINVVYVGSLSMSTMYTREFARWVIANQGRVKWDIYSYNITDDARVFLSSLGTNSIQLKNGVNYNDLPGILQKYDAGVILYKGHTSNYVYNAPNKLFEYLASGLDVWFPDIMKGIHPYKTVNTFPKALAIDFARLERFSLESAINKEGYMHGDQQFFCEQAFSLLSKTICY